jgi:hypothetical protein
MAGAEVPRTLEDVAALEAAYRPFEPASAWSGISCDTGRWQRHADALADAVERTEASAWADLRERFLRAAALDSSALGELIRPVPDLTSVVLRASLRDDGWTSVVEGNRLVVECHRRALVVAADAAATGRPIDENLIARLQDLIVESQQSYTVSTEDGSRIEVELPRHQYKPVSNYSVNPLEGLGIVAFAPAGRVADEMHRLAAEFASDAFAQLHPVIQSAYAHFSLTCIHPFADGNGRLCRTVASIPPLREVGLPQLILADQWPAYLRALARAHLGDVTSFVELFLTVQVNTMALARDLVEAGALGEVIEGVPATDSPERTLLDLVLFHVRAALGVPERDLRLSVSRDAPGAAGYAARVALTDAEGLRRVDVGLSVAADGNKWMHVTASTGDTLELAADDVDPVPLEIAHLRVRAWLDRVLHQGGAAPRAAPQARGLFVVGVPRSGTTLMGNYLGSHPDVLGLAEYGGFYVAHSVAPAYVNRLPGREHEGFLAELTRLATEHVVAAARERNCSWYCDATPWNLEVGGALAAALPDALFVLMLRHFSGAILSLEQFGWVGETAEDAARLWVRLNECIPQLPADRTLVVSYDVLAEQPAETVAGIHEALASAGLDAEGFDAMQLTASHAAVVGRPRPTIAQLIDGQLVFRSIPSLDEQRWTPEIHARVWPIVKPMHRALADQFPGVYAAPPRPGHVAENEW